MRSILARSLALAKHDELLVIADENHAAEIVVISEVASRLGIAVSSLVIPAAAQRRITAETALPALVRAAIRECRAMIVLADYSTAGTPFRLSVLGYFTGLRKQGRAASMPGVSLGELHYASADHAEIDRSAARLATLLARTKVVTVVTTGPQGDACTLRVPLDGSLPIACGSVIEEGVWDNVPSGETFALPRRNRASGRVAIDGSVPGLVVAGRCPVVLEIERGKIAAVACADAEVEEYVAGLFFRAGGGRRSPISRNAHVLCEIGFGVNRAIKRLHGLPVIDEKMRGTVHLAFGRNDQLGGCIKGRSHHDLVILRPSVWFDCQPAAVISKRRFLPGANRVRI